MGKFLNSEQAKAEEAAEKAVEEEKTLEELQAENQQLKGEAAMLKRKLQVFGDQLAQYAIEKVNLEIQVKELQQTGAQPR